MSDSSLIIATRKSPLALAQANSVAAQLCGLYSELSVELLELSTRGDEILDRTLSKVGGKGLFVKELERALKDDAADLAVHSLKDVPMTLPRGFGMAAILQREDPRDALVCNRYATLAEMPAGAIVGTASLRRTVMLKRRYPKLDIRTLRGNVGTRLAKLDAGEYDAIILAAAGLTRLGLGSRIRAPLSVEESLPAPGQAALGIEIVSANDELAELLAPLDHAPTAMCCTAERALSRALGGNCDVPLAAYATLDGEMNLWLRAWLADESGARFVEAEGRGGVDDPEGLGTRVAAMLKAAWDKA